MNWTRAAIMAAAIAVGGCLPTDDPRPSCFADEPCPGDEICVAGTCQTPAPRAIELRLEGCIGASGGACRETLEPRLAFNATGARACLVVGDRAVQLRWDPATGFSPSGSPGAPVTLPLRPSRQLETGLFFLDEDASCGPELLRAEGCDTARGCQFVLRRPGWIVPDGDGPVTLAFDDDGCRIEWGGERPIERCDGRDEDCDGLADQTFPVGTECAVGRGGCARNGTWTCALDGRSAVCDGEPAEPGVETADGTDEDCDGTIDEGQSGCTPDVVRPCSTEDGICTVGVQRCDPDDPDIHGPCLDENGTPVITPGSRDERCDGVDEDCDGAVDEGITLAGQAPGVDPLEVGDRCRLSDDCAVFGQVACGPDGLALCLPSLEEPPDELCNGVDDDCDGAIDELFPDVGMPCVAGVGGCAVDGVMECTGDGLDTGCDAQAGQPEAERCDSPIDDDCDGEVDEDFPQIGEPCDAGVGACRATGAYACDFDQPTQVFCGVVLGEPVDEVCNGIDDDCDGEVDNGFDLLTDVDHCGVCDRACMGPNATMACDGGFCVVEQCNPGYTDDDQLADTGCECNAQLLDEPDPEAAEPDHASDPDCDGLDGERDGAIFVSARHGDDGAAGDADGPVRSLTLAVELARAGALAIYMDVGRYALVETLAMPSGVDVHGGYRYDPQDGWSAERVPRDEAVTEIAGPARTLVYRDLEGPTMLDRVVVISEARGDGSSVAVSAVDVADHLFLRDVVLRSGDGAPGQRGTDGARGPDGAEPGARGFTGTNALCAGCGGRGGRNEICPADGGRGGGGGGQQDFDDEEVPATVGLPGIGPGGGDGGAPGVEPSESGQPGQDGDRGANGVNGEPGEAGGAVIDGIWRPASSGVGGPGAAGSGGGGGGGGLRAAGRQTYGGGGGGGGAGGCPGDGGLGAGGGGASIALFIAGGRVGLHAVRLEPGRGGAGGIGGAGGAGVAGRDGGNGAGHPTCQDCGRGGVGGRGGDGGCGGHAGGGAGGPAFAVLRVGPPRDGPLDTDVVPANPYGAPLDADAAAEARASWLAVGVPGVGGAGGSLAGCGDDAAPGAGGVGGAIGCCTLAEDASCRLEVCE